MSTITKSVTINAPTSRIWDAIKDVGYVHNWHPVVEASPVLSDNASGLGASRRCEMYDGSSVVETVTELTEGRRVVLELSDFSLPLNNASASITLDPVDDGTTRVTMEMNYEVKYGPAGWLMDQMMMKRMMGSLFLKVLGGLDHHVRTGEYVGKDFKPAELAA